MANYDDATMYQPGFADNNQFNDPNGQFPPVPYDGEEVNEKKKDGTMAAALAGVAGVVVGAAAGGGVAYAATRPEEETPAEEDVQVDNDDANVNISGEMTCDDSLSFSQAFAQARAQLGPGGVFHWHGGTYGTYYANEWNAMSPAEQEAFTAEAMHYHEAPVATAAKAPVAQNTVVHHHTVVYEDDMAHHHHHHHHHGPYWDDDSSRDDEFFADNNSGKIDQGGVTTGPVGNDPNDEVQPDTGNTYEVDQNIGYEEPDEPGIDGTYDSDLHLTSADVDSYNGMSDYMNDVQEA